jgi:uncharacterized protein YcgL (UPF0745 family)
VAIYAYTSPKLRSWALLTHVKDDFSRIPRSEMERFGTPIFVREVNPNRELPPGVRKMDIEKAEKDGYAFLEMTAIYKEKTEPKSNA